MGFLVTLVLPGQISGDFFFFKVYFCWFVFSLLHSQLPLDNLSSILLTIDMLLLLLLLYWLQHLLFQHGLSGFYSSPRERFIYSREPKLGGWRRVVRGDHFKALGYSTIERDRVFQGGVVKTPRQPFPPGFPANVRKTRENGKAATQDLFPTSR